MQLISAAIALPLRIPLCFEPLICPAVPAPVGTITCTKLFKIYTKIVDLIQPASNGTSFNSFAPPSLFL
jgi:hypothetical protein